MSDALMAFSYHCTLDLFKISFLSFLRSGMKEEGRDFEVSLQSYFFLLDVDSTSTPILLDMNYPSPTPCIDTLLSCFPTHI